MVDNWYSNKELFEMFQSLKEDLLKTRDAVRKYNNLVEKMQNTDTKLEQACCDIKEVQQQLIRKQTKSEGTREAFELLRTWTPWVISIITVLYFAGKGGAF